MNKKLFDRNLYREGLRQTRIIGIIQLVVMLEGIILIPLENIGVSMLLDGKFAVPEEARELVNLIEMNPLISICAYIFAPLYVMYLFRFLNKRNTSDFYHAIPQTRSCLFISFSAAIVSWMVGVMAISTLISLGIYSFCSKYYIIHWALVLPTFLNMTASALFVMAVMLLAVSMTGTGLNNLIVGTLILFFPRFFYTVCQNQVYDALPILSEIYTPMLLNSSFNIPVGIIMELFSFNNDSVMELSLYSTQAFIYTICLAIVYFALAWLIFRRRKSETATHSALNTKLQAAIRIVFSLLFCLLPISCFFCMTIGQDGAEIGIVSFYLIAVVAYFLFEIITTKTVKRLVKIIPGLGILAIINIAVVAVMYFSYQSVLHFTPRTEEVESVEIILGNNIFSNFVPSVKVNDKETIRIVTEKLEEEVQNIKDGDYYSMDFSQSMDIGIYTHGATRYRHLYFSDKEYDNILQQLLKNHDFQKSCKNLPSDKNKIIGLDIDSYEMCDLIFLPQEKLWELYSVALSEVQQMDDVQWIKNCQGVDSDKKLLFFITVRAIQDKDEISVSVPVTDEMKKTVNAYIELKREAGYSHKATLLKELALIGEGKSIYNSSFCFSYNCGYISYIDDPAVINDICAYLSVQEDIYSEQSDILYIEAYDEEKGALGYYFAIDGDTLPESFQKILSEYDFYVYSKDYIYESTY